MIPVKHIDPDDLALYAMQLLPPEEMEEMALHLQHSVEARRVLSEFYGDLAAVAHTAEMHSPPALARQRLMKHVAREKKAIPINRDQQVGAYAPRATTLLDEEPAKKNTGAKVLAWTGWAIAAGLAAGAFLINQDREHLKNDLASNKATLNQTQLSAEAASLLMENVKDPSAVRVALTSTGVKPPPEGRASYVPDKGSLVFIASNLDPLPPYKTYQLWLIPEDQHDPISAGVFKPDVHGNASVVLPTLPRGVQAKAFGVTIEDGDGATLPTMPIVLKGLAS